MFGNEIEALLEVGTKLGEFAAKDSAHAEKIADLQRQLAEEEAARTVNHQAMQAYAEAKRITIGVFANN